MPNANQKAKTELVPATSSLPTEFAALADQMGWKPLVGRVIGELMLSEEPSLSTVQLCERIGVSKGHLSSAIQALETAGYLERFTKLGTRQHFYRLRSNAFARALKESIWSVRRIKELAEEALESVPQGGRAAKELALTRDFYELAVVRLEELADEFLKAHS